MSNWAGRQALKPAPNAAQIFDNVHDAVISTNLDGIVLTWNESARRIYGYEPDEAVGRHIRFLYFENEQPLVEQRGWASLRNQGGRDVLVRHRHKAGTEVFVEVRFCPLNNEAGTPTGMITFANDVTAKRSSEAESRRNDEIFRVLVDGVQDYAIVPLDSEGTVIAWNAGAERIFAYSAAEIVGQHFSCFYPEGDIIAGVPDIALQVAAHEGRFEHECWHDRRNGTQFWSSTLITALMDDRGQARGFCKLVRDLTHQKRSASVLRESESRYRGMFESNHHLVQSVSVDGKFLFVNPAWLNALGYSMSELTELRFETVLHPNGRAFAQELLARVRAGELLKTVEAEFRGKDGRLIAVEGNVAGHKVEGKVVAMHGFFRDVTDRKLAERELKTSEARLRQIIDLVPHHIFAKDRAGKFLLANRALAKGFGMTVEKIVGQSHAAIHHSKDEAAKMLSDDLEVIETGTPKFIPVEHFTDAAGVRRFVQTIRIPFTELGSNEPAVLGVATDITELWKAQEQSLQHERLRGVAQMMSSLVHESQNAIGIIQMAVEVLAQNRAQSGADRELVAQIQQALDELVQLFEIQQYADPVDLKLSSCALVDVWRDAWARIESRWPARGAKLSEHADGVNLECIIDRARWVQVFRTIFENALAACGDPAVIEIAGDEQGQAALTSLRIRIRDNRPGLSAEECERMFEPFRTTSADSAGLGMAIVKRVVEAHGGTIVATSRAEQGVELAITLPT